MDEKKAEVSHPGRKSGFPAQFPDMSQFSDPEPIDSKRGWVPM